MTTFLGELSLNNDTKVVVAQTVGSSLVDLMRSGDMPQREAALRALNNISSYEGSAKVLISIGILPPLIKDLFYVGPNNLPIRLKEVSATILANIVNTGYDFDKATTLFSDNRVENLLYLISNTGPAIQCKLLEVLVGLTTSQKTVQHVVSAVKTSGAIISLVQFVEVRENDDLRLASIKLLHNLSPFMSEELAGALRGTAGQLDSLVAIISEKTPISEEQAAAAGLLAELPERDSALTREMLSVGAFEKIVSKVIGIRQGEIRGMRFERNFLEGLVRILSRITFAFGDEARAVTFFCREYDVASLFIQLLQSNGQDSVQMVSATALENLSLESINLSHMPDLPPPSCGSIFSCMSRPPVVTGLCKIHHGVCSLKETFCLVEGEAVEKLVALLDHENDKVVEASLAALSSLLEDGLDVKKGVKILDEADGIRHVLNVLTENRTEKLTRRAVWLVERILRIEDIAREVAEQPNVSASLVDAFQNGDFRTRQIAENALKHIDKIPNFSGIFPNMA